MQWAHGRHGNSVYRLFKWLNVLVWVIRLAKYTTEIAIIGWIYLRRFITDVAKPCVVLEIRSDII